VLTESGPAIAWHCYER